MSDESDKDRSSLATNSENEKMGNDDVNNSDTDIQKHDENITMIEDDPTFRKDSSKEFGNGQIQTLLPKLAAVAFLVVGMTLLISALASGSGKSDPNLIQACHILDTQRRVNGAANGMKLLSDPAVLNYCSIRKQQEGCTIPTCPDECPVGFERRSGCPSPNCECIRTGVVHGDIFYDQGDVSDKFTFGGEQALSAFDMWDAVTDGVKTSDPKDKASTKVFQIWSTPNEGVHFIPYEIDSSFSSKNKSIIVKALKSFAQVSCVKFVEKTEKTVSGTDFVSIKQAEKGELCSATVGKSPGRNLIVVNGECISLHSMQKLIMHTLGFVHEHTRPDRDKYVQIIMENVHPQFRSAFNKVLATFHLDLGVEYNPQSIMHFPSFAFSKDDKSSTIVGKSTKVTGEDGNIDEKLLQESDITALNVLYQCPRYRQHIESLSARWAEWSTWDKRGSDCIRFRICTAPGSGLPSVGCPNPNYPNQVHDVEFSKGCTGSSVRTADSSSASTPEARMLGRHGGHNHDEVNCGCTFSKEDTGHDLTTTNRHKTCVCSSTCIFQLKEVPYYEIVNWIVGGKDNIYPIDLHDPDRQYQSNYKNWKLQNNLCMAASYSGLIGKSGGRFNVELLGEREVDATYKMLRRGPGMRNSIMQYQTMQPEMHNVVKLSDYKKTTGPTTTARPTTAASLSKKAICAGGTLFAARYNNDDRDDIFCIHKSGNVEIYMNENGEFGAPKWRGKVGTCKNRGTSQRLYVTDMTGDGYSDLACVDSKTGKLEITYFAGPGHQYHHAKDSNARDSYYASVPAWQHIFGDCKESSGYIPVIKHMDRDCQADMVCFKTAEPERFRQIYMYQNTHTDSKQKTCRKTLSPVSYIKE